jgi:hypothetical protein
MFCKKRPTQNPIRASSRRLLRFCTTHRDFNLHILFALWLICGFVSSSALADSVCSICGEKFGTQVYLIQDKLTEEKKQVCSNCTMTAPRCYICGLPVAKDTYAAIPDGRALCARDARTAVLDEQEARRVAAETRQELDRLLSRFMIVPESNVVFEIVDRPHLQMLFKFAGQDFECPIVYGYIETQTNHEKLEHYIHVLSGLPKEMFKATCAHEFTHAWLNENLSEHRKSTVARDAVEGFCELVSFRLMDSLQEEGQKKLILLNAYTRGQVQLFIEAEQRFGFDDIADWMKSGADSRLAADDPSRVRKIEGGRARPFVAQSFPTNTAEPPPVPATLLLKGIVWSKSRPTALINDRSFEAREEGKVRVGKENMKVRCLEIHEDWVRIQLVDSGQEQELRLKPRQR